jgi:hypothetical protein
MPRYDHQVALLLDVAKAACEDSLPSGRPAARDLSLHMNMVLVLWQNISQVFTGIQQGYAQPDVSCTLAAAYAGLECTECGQGSNTAIYKHPSKILLC